MTAFQNMAPEAGAEYSPSQTDSSFSSVGLGNESAVSFTPGTKLREIERIVILETLKQKNFNRTHTARALGIGIRTLQRKLKRYGASDWGLKTIKADA